MVTLIYSVPGFARSRLLNAVAGGWQVGGITTWRAGFPVNPFAGVNRANTNIGNDRPDATGQQVALDQPTTNQWFNTAAFALQPIYTFVEQAQKDRKPFFLWYAPMLAHQPAKLKRS